MDQDISSITELIPPTAFRRMQTPEGTAVADAVDRFNSLLSGFNSHVSTHSEARADLVQGMQFASQASSPGGPLTPSSGQSLPVEASHGQANSHYLRQLENRLGVANDRAVEWLDSITNGLDNVHTALRGWQDSRHGHQTPFDVQAFRSLRDSEYSAHHELQHNVATVNAIAADLNELERQRHLPSPMARQSPQAPSPQFSPDLSSQHSPAPTRLSASPPRQTAHSYPEDGWSDDRRPSQRPLPPGMVRPQTYPTQGGGPPGPTKHFHR